jgi:DNA mismatch repair protein MutS2
MERIDRRRVGPSLAIAFTTGGTPGVLEDLPVMAEAPPAGWEPDFFAQDLFLDSLLDWLVRLKACGEPVTADPRELMRLLVRPACDSDLCLRHAVFAELRGSADLRQQAEEAYRAVQRVRALLSSSHSERGDGVQARRMEILRAVRAAVELLGGQFEQAQGALGRVGAFAREASASAGFQRMVDLLEYEASHTTIDLRLGLGYDGGIRAFEVVEIRENRGNAFWASPLVRLLRKLLMWLSGYGFREAEVLSRAMDAVFEQVQELVVGLFELEAGLAFYLSGLRMADCAKGCGLQVCLPHVGSAGPRSFEALFNPLLLAAGAAPVPSSIALHDGQSITVVTGPNSGGKTRLLEAVGLAQLLAEAGFLVPAAAASVRRASGMLASMQVEFGLGHTEGHLGTELLRVRQAFEKLPPGGFVLLDELCSGTNPAEAHELIELVVELLAQLGTHAFISTHFLDLASRLQQQHAGAMAFLQVEIDPERRPTYRVVPGVATSSLARETATRLGITRAELLELAAKAGRGCPR